MRLQLQNQETKKIKLNLLLIPLVLCLAVVQILLSNRMITSGDTLKKMQSQTDVFETQNQRLKAEIASLGSLERLKLESSRLGFSSPAPVINISGQKEFALNN